ncbi:MAG: PTS sugar transporter subunit IIC [Erysipelotrichaceae bacterium]
MILQLAIAAGIMYFLGHCCLGYWFYDVFGQPLFIGLVLGIVAGDIHTGMVLGGTIQLVYLGMIFAGGNLPADAGLAAVIAIPIALLNGMSAETAVVLAVPFGVLGTFIDQIRRTLNAVFIHKADSFAEEGNTKGIIFCGTVLPVSFAFLLRFPPVFAAIMAGTDVVQNFMNVVPTWLMHGLEVAGGVLPAMGFAIVIFTIGKKTLLPYFIMGFFAVMYLQIPTMAAAVFGGCIAILTIFNAQTKRKEKTQ